MLSLSRARLLRAARTLPRRSLWSPGTPKEPVPKKAGGNVVERLGEKELQALERELDRLRESVVQRGNQFSSWKQRNTFKFLALGGVGGAAILTGSAAAYVYHHPQVVEFLVSKVALLAYDHASTYEGRLAVYLGLPEPDVPLESLEAEALKAIARSWGSSELKGPGSEDLGLQWAARVVDAFARLDGSSLLSTKSDLRERLRLEVVSDTTLSLGEKLRRLREVLPPSWERNVFVDDCLAKAAKGLAPTPSAGTVSPSLLKAGWHARDVLEANPPSLQALPCEVATSLMRSSVTFFPGPTNKLVLMLRGRVTCREVAESMCKGGGADVAAMEQALATLTSRFQRLLPALQSRVLLEGITTTISILPTLGPPSAGMNLVTLNQVGGLNNSGAPSSSLAAPGLRPYDLYKRAIDVDLLGPLRRDANISTQVLDQVKQVFLALPPFIQARILLCAIEDPHGADSGATPDQQAETVRNLLAAGGIVSVKLAQMIAEDPRVPAHYRNLLGSLRDDNEAMGSLEFWHRLPETIRQRIAALGPCLGTGSVKQVHLAMMEQPASSPPLSTASKQLSNGDGKAGAEAASSSKAQLRTHVTKSTHGSASNTDDSSPSGSPCGGPSSGGQGSGAVAVAVLRRGVEEEALASLTALEASWDLQPVASRLGRMVYGEFNLFAEGEALEEFALTSIARNPLFKVVKVRHHSPKCLVEQIAVGKTVAKALKGAGKDWRDDKALLASDPYLEVTMATLVAFHRTVLAAFVEDGLIHSDVHLGNVVQELQADGTVKFVLFDVGQFERIGPAETSSLLWALSWISTRERHTTLRAVALSHLTAVSALTGDDDAPSGAGASNNRVAQGPKELARRIEKAFDDAVAPFEDGTVPDKKTSWILFLRNAEREGVALPKGAFAIAKMMDGIVSQQDSYALPAVLDDAVEAFLTRNMTWAEMVSVGSRTAWARATYAK